MNVRTCDELWRCQGHALHRLRSFYRFSARRIVETTMAIAQDYGGVLAPAASLQVRCDHSQKQRSDSSQVGADLLVTSERIKNSNAAPFCPERFSPCPPDRRPEAWWRRPGLSTSWPPSPAFGDPEELNHAGSSFWFAESHQSALGTAGELRRIIADRRVQNVQRTFRR